MRTFTAITLAAVLAFAAPAVGDEVSDFYKGKQVQLIIGYGAGGGYDLTGRMLARHMGNFIPGNPVVIVQNMPGAGSLRAANHIQQVAARDGTVMGALDRQVSLTAVLGGNPAVKFTAPELNFLGTLSSYSNDAFILWLRKDAPVKNTADLLRPGGPEATVGGSAIGSTDDTTIIILRDVLKLRLRLVTGYPDGNTISLALERNEVQGRIAGLSAIASTRPEWLKPDSHVRPLLQVGRTTRLPAYPDIPTARELAEAAGPQAKSVIEAMELTYQLARPYIVPPGVPAARLAALRKAFMDTATSKAMQEEAAKMSVELSPTDGETATRLVAGMAKAPPEALDYLRKLLGSAEAK